MSVPERTNLQVMPEWVCVCALDGSKAICPYDSLISCGDELLTAVFFLPIPDRGCICLIHTINCGLCTYVYLKTPVDIYLAFLWLELLTTK